jgi:hypothetical protein
VNVEDNWSPPVYDKSDEERGNIKRVLDRNILFGTLDDKTKETIVSAMSKRRFSEVNFFNLFSMCIEPH